jgi:hypothetical protein
MHLSTDKPQKKHWAQPQLIFISQVSIEAKTNHFGHENTFVKTSAAAAPGHHWITFQGPAHSISVPLAVTVQDFIS